MKPQPHKLILTLVSILLLFNANYGQVPDLKSATNYVLFTKTGALGNTGISQISGNIGTNNGAITGFELPTTIIGNIDSGNAITVQAAIDLQSAYDQLFNSPPTSTSHTPSFGGGETLFAGVYAIAAAGSIAGHLTLDAQWNPNAAFIFKFGGAFTTGASTTIHLINGASACNVFWGAEGAIALAAVTIMKGTLIANNGAISMGADGDLEGRLFSTTGAASIYQVTVSLPCSDIPLSIDLTSFTGICDRQAILLKWTTGSAINNDFIAERSVGGINWEVVGTVVGSASSTFDRSFTLIDKLPNRQTSLYRLKQTDNAGKTNYGNVIAIKKCAENNANDLIVFPNPTSGQFEISFKQNSEQVHSVEIFDSRSKKIYQAIGAQSTFDLSANPSGIYFIRVQSNHQWITMPVIIEKPF